MHHELNNLFDSPQNRLSGTSPALPEHILTGYWHNFDNGAKCLKISDVPIQYDIIVVSFADSTSTPGAITFNLDPALSTKLGGYTKHEFIRDIHNAKERGQKVILSVGGELGNIEMQNSEHSTNFSESMFALMTEYGFDGVDIDLEHGINIDTMETALRQLYTKVGPDLIIALAPQTFDMQDINTSYFKLARSIKDILTVVNTQFYNSNPMYGLDSKLYEQGGVDFITALAALQLESGLRPDQIGLGFPSCVKAAGSGYVDPSIIIKAYECLTRGTAGGLYSPPGVYPSLRGLMTWSINWDASFDYTFANSVVPVLKG